MDTPFFSSKDIKTLKDARAYLKSRAKDAVLAWRSGHHLEGHTINNPRFW